MSHTMNMPDINGVKSRHRVKNPDGIDLVIRAIDKDKTGRYGAGDYGRYVSDHGIPEKPEPVMNKRKPVTVKRICPQCGYEFEVDAGCKRTFCSRSCASAHSVKLRKNVTEKATCVWCGAEFMRSKSYGRNFCSDLCYRNYVCAKQREKRAIKGTSTEFYSEG